VVVDHEIHDLGEAGPLDSGHLDFQRRVVAIVVVVLTVFGLTGGVPDQIGNLSGRHGNVKHLGVPVLVRHGPELDHGGIFAVGVHRCCSFFFFGWLAFEESGE
jgi:hypothetical protein